MAGDAGESAAELGHDESTWKSRVVEAIPIFSHVTRGSTSPGVAVSHVISQ
jgi:hypothetical protein